VVVGRGEARERLAPARYFRRIVTIFVARLCA
jgi:hypothetical protein